MLRAQNFIILIVVSSCIMACGRQNERCYYVKYDSITNLRNDQEIYCNTRHVGKLMAISIAPSGHKAVLKIEVEKDFHLEKDDTITLVEYSDRRMQSIYIIPGKGATERYHYGDTVAGKVLTHKRFLDQLSEIMFRTDTAAVKLVWDSMVVPLLQHFKTHEPNEQTENGR